MKTEHKKLRPRSSRKLTWETQQ